MCLKAARGEGEGEGGREGGGGGGQEKSEEERRKGWRGGKVGGERRGRSHDCVLCSAFARYPDGVIAHYYCAKVNQQGQEGEKPVQL